MANQLTTKLEQQLQAALEQARRACQTEGNGSSQCATSWDVVEDLKTALSQRRSPFEQYCAERPDADECRIYDV